MRGITVTRLDENGVLAQALCENLTVDVDKVDALANMTTSVFYGRVAMDAGEETKTEPVSRSGGVCETVHHHVVQGRSEYLAHAIVELVVDYGAPIRRLLVLDCYSVVVCGERKWL